MTQEEVYDELQAKLKKATLTSLAKTGELAKLKAYIAAHLYAEITNGQKPVDPKFVPKAMPSKDELDFLLSTLNKYQLTSTLKVLTLELGITGDYTSQAYNSAHQTSESMSISPNRYQHNYSETESAHNYELENDDFGFVGQQQGTVLPTSVPDRKEIPAKEAQNYYAKPAVAEPKVVKQEPEKPDVKEADIFDDFDDLKEFDDLEGLDTGKKADSAGDLDNFDDLEDLDFDSKEPAQKMVGSADQSQKSLKEEPPAVSLGARDTVGSSGKTDNEQDALDNFDDLEFDEPDKKTPSDKRQNAAELAAFDDQPAIQQRSGEPVEAPAYKQVADKPDSFGDDLDNFDDLQFDEPEQAPKKELPKTTKPAAVVSAYKYEQKTQKRGYGDDIDLDNFDDLDDLDFNDYEQIKIDNEPAKKAPSSIDNLPDYGDMMDLGFDEPDVKNPAKKVDLDDFGDLDDLDFDEPKNDGKNTSKPKQADIDELDDLDDFGDLQEPKNPKRNDKKAELDAMDNFDDFKDLDGLDFGFNEKEHKKAGLQNDFDFENFDDL